MRKGLAVSGWFGRSRLSEFRADDEGRADFILRLIDQLNAIEGGVSADAAEVLRAGEPLYEIHFEAQRSRFPRAAQFLVLIEDRHIRPQNFFVSRRKYAAVFSWDDDIVCRLSAYKYIFPAHLAPGPVGDLARRPVFLTMVAANKAQAVWTRDDLYKERVSTLRWYEANAPQQFSLYGSGWDLPVHTPGLFSKALFKGLKRLRIARGNRFQCWRGIAASKRDVLAISRFALCYENTKGCMGYISEKVYDAISAGSVPVYWGAPNVEKYIPRECFIDRREFSGNAEMHRYLLGISDAQYSEMQGRMREFAIANRERVGVDRFASYIAEKMSELIPGRE